MPKNNHSCTKTAIAKVSKSVQKTCAYVDKIWGLLVHKQRTETSITRHLSIVLLVSPYMGVCKHPEQTASKPALTHTLSPTIFSQITDMLSDLYTLSTPPITTTTNIFN
jgi:hypothetical protein